MGDIEKRLQQLEDKAEIAALIASYGPLADRGEAWELASLWAEDGEYTIAGYGTAKGRDAIAALIKGEVHLALMAEGCAHILSQHVITLLGDYAKATGYSIVFRKSDAGFNAWRVSSNNWKLLRTNSGWRVQSRMNAPLDGSQAARALLEIDHDS